KDRLDLVIKYVEAQRSMVKPLPPPDKPWPGDDWISRSEFAQADGAKEKLRDWALATENLKPLEVDESKNTAADLGKSYRKPLYQAQFTMDLYTAPFPFVDSGQPQEISEDRFKLGEEFMHQMQCLTCHYLGDPNAPGAVKDPKAPNLSLAHERLQRRWIRHWV